MGFWFLQNKQTHKISLFCIDFFPYLCRDPPTLQNSTSSPNPFSSHAPRSTKIPPRPLDLPVDPLAPSTFQPTLPPCSCPSYLFHFPSPAHCFWPWSNFRRGRSWPSHATPAEPSCPQPGNHHHLSDINHKNQNDRNVLIPFVCHLGFWQWIKGFSTKILLRYFSDLHRLYFRWTRPLRPTLWGQSYPRRQIGWNNCWWISNFLWKR